MVNIDYDFLGTLKLGKMKDMVLGYGRMEKSHTAFIRMDKDMEEGKLYFLVEMCTKDSI